MGKWLERVIEKRDSRDKKSCNIPKINTDKTDNIPVLDYLTELEREYFFNLVEFMESPEHRMDRETAEQEAREIVTEYRLRKKQRLERGERGFST